jgi:hypothetical protein
MIKRIDGVLKVSKIGFIDKCSSLLLHNFKDFNSDTKCIACKKSVKEVIDDES